jgi:hypothetical protein
MMWKTHLELMKWDVYIKVQSLYQSSEKRNKLSLGLGLFNNLYNWETTLLSGEIAVATVSPQRLEQERSALAASGPHPPTPLEVPSRFPRFRGVHWFTYSRHADRNSHSQTTEWWLGTVKQYFKYTFGLLTGIHHQLINVAIARAQAFFMDNTQERAVNHRVGPVRISN